MYKLKAFRIDDAIDDEDEEAVVAAFEKSLNDWVKKNPVTIISHNLYLAGGPYSQSPFLTVLYTTKK